MKTATLSLFSMVLAFNFAFSIVGVPLVVSYFIVFVALWLTPKEILQFTGFALVISIPDLWKLYCHMQSIVLLDAPMTMIFSVFTALPMYLVLIFGGRWLVQKTLHIRQRVGIIVND